jgi:hypothetical protein
MNKIKVDLNVIEDLFQEPEFNPFDPGCRCESGVADLFNQTQNLSPKEPVQIEISLATQPEETDILGKTETTLRRYCKVKIVQSEREIREIRHQGKRDLGWALTISVILLLGAYLVTQLTFLPEIIIYLLSTGAGIIAWVTLWPPLDSVLYEWSPYRQTKLHYQQLQAAQIVITPSKKIDKGSL